MGLLYPTDVPVNEVTSLINTIRSGRISEDRKAFAKDIWIVEGYLLGKAIGDDVAVLGSFAPIAPLTDDEAVAILSDLVAEPSAVKGAIPIPWVSLLKWATQLVLTLL